MKTALILTALLCASAWAADKKTERRSPKSVGETHLDSVTGNVPLEKDSHATQNKAQQLEAKKGRQFQEERPEEKK